MTREFKDVCLQMVCHLTSVPDCNMPTLLFSPVLPYMNACPVYCWPETAGKVMCWLHLFYLLLVSAAAGTDAQIAVCLLHWFSLISPTSMHAQCTVGPRLKAKPCAGATSVTYCWCLTLLALMHRFQLFPGQLCHFTTSECVCPEQWYHCLHPVCLAYGGCGHCHLAVPLWSPGKGNHTAQGSWLSPDPPPPPPAPTPPSPHCTNLHCS